MPAVAHVRAALSALTLLVAGAAATQPTPPAQPTDPKAAPAEAAKPSDTPKQPDSDKPAKALTAQDHLEACKKLYAAAKTYRDEGTLESVIDTGPQKLTESKPFSTAFERGGRFRWQFEHSAMPGRKPDQKFIVWSDNQKTFKTSWTLTGKNDTFPSIDLAMAGPTGVSGGSAIAVIPMLRPDADFPLRSISLQAPQIVGTDKLGDVECTMIRGHQPLTEATITLWLDPNHAIRKIKSNTDVDPSKLPGGADTSKFKVETVIRIKPTFDEKLEDKYFEK